MSSRPMKEHSLSVVLLQVQAREQVSLLAVFREIELTGSPVVGRNMQKFGRSNDIFQEVGRVEVTQIS